MTNLPEVFKAAQNFTVHNAPAILTAVSVAGVISTAVVSNRAGYRSEQIISEAVGHPDSPWHAKELTRKEVVNLVWREYIPVVGASTLTIAAIIGANRLGDRRAAAAAAAYTISERAFEEYRKKAHQHLGDRAEQRVRDEVAQDRVDKAGLDSTTLIISDDNKVLCYDLYSGRPFVSTVEDIKKAQNDTNYQMLREDSVSLSDFYSRLDADPVGGGDHLGWNTDTKMEVVIQAMLSSEQKPVVTIDFKPHPYPDYWKFR